MKTTIRILSLAAALALVMVGCDEISELATPSVTYKAIESGTKLRLEWAAVADADGYKVMVDDSTFETTQLTVDVEGPAGSIAVWAYAGDTDSDKWELDCKAKVTTGLDVYAISDPDTLHASGFGFKTEDGLCVIYSVKEANRPMLDWYVDDVNVTPMSFVNPGDHVPPYNSKMNAAKDLSGSNFDDHDIADATGYSSQEAVATSLYDLWMSADNDWDDTDHFAKLLVTNIDALKVSFKVAYQKIGGLRWLVTE